MRAESRFRLLVVWATFRACTGAWVTRSSKRGGGAEPESSPAGDKSKHARRDQRDLRAREGPRDCPGGLAHSGGRAARVVPAALLADRFVAGAVLLDTVDAGVTAGDGGPAGGSAGGAAGRGPAGAAGDAVSG